MKIVGILNITPDSFYDGGKFVSVESAVSQAGEMIRDGADILEIGGESSGPRSPLVPLEEEIKRVIPVLRAIRKAHPQALLSIDTYKSPVAQAAIDEGVMMVNDVTAGRSDPEMFSVIAKSGVQFVMMFSKDATPRTTIEDRKYDDVITVIKKFLSERTQLAIEAGVKKEQIILDPGLGHFVSSDAKYSFQILAHLKDFSSLGYPLFVSPSRKSFVSGKENLPIADRLPGTITASAIAVMNGAIYIRTHDVKEVRRGCEIAGHIKPE